MPKAEDDTPLKLEEVLQLLDLARNNYQRQSHACLAAKAPLGSCILAGAAVETILIAVTCLLYPEAILTGKAPKYTECGRTGETKELLNWSFYELLKVARAAKWIPDTVKLKDTLDFRPQKTQVRTDSIREVRNLVHPARYLKDRGGKEYTHE
jgi:hypothetical protein